jgi:integrase
MASIDRTPTGWRARWRAPDGGSRSKNFARQVDAQRHLVATEHGKLTGLYVDPSAGRITFKVYAEQWRTRQVHRPGTVTQVERNLRRHVYDRLGSRPIGAVRQSEVQAAVKEMATTLSAATVELIYTYVASIFKAAVDDQVIARTPCRNINRPVVEKASVTPLATETVEALIDSVPGRYRALVVLGVGTGVRISEALGLTSDRVDWMRRSVTIDRQLVGVRDRQPVFGPVKDRKNRPRTIPLPDVVLNALVEHVRVYGTGPDALVFTNDRGQPIRRTTFSDTWRKAADPLGVPLGDGFHQLRHYYASLLIHHGESVKVVQDRLGHYSATMTLDIYGHLWPDSEDRTRQAVDDVLGSMGGEKSAGQVVESS